MAASVGTLAWSQRSGGVIGVGDKMVLLFQGLQTAFGSLVSRTFRIGSRFPFLPVDPQAFIKSKIPSNQRFRRPACSQASSAALAIPGRSRSGSGECSEGPAEPPCFAVRGGAEAYRLAGAHDWDESKSKALYEAISMHLNARINRTKRPEAFAMASGTALDVAGVGFSRLPDEVISAALDPVWHPRTKSSQNDGARYDGIHSDMWKLWSAEARCHPNCRGQFLNAPFGLVRLGLKRRIDDNPLDRQGFALGDAQ